MILDSLATGSPSFSTSHIFYKGDVGDVELIEAIFRQHPDINCVIHCAASIIVPDSVTQPYEYYRNNVSKSLELFNNLVALGCTRLIFSSSAAVYDSTAPGFMMREESRIQPSSPYARSKVMTESMLQDICDSTDLRAITLRYFNPIGADPSMRSGPHTQNASHILAKLIDVAFGKEPAFRIAGTDWPTRDGTGIRDYIHVWDLASAHVNAVERFDTAFTMDDRDNPAHCLINLGTGYGVTVKELITAFESVIGKTIPTEDSHPRLGDVAGAYANADIALKLLGWQPKFTLEEAVYHAIEWYNVQNKTCQL